MLCVSICSCVPTKLSHYPLVSIPSNSFSPDNKRSPSSLRHLTFPCPSPDLPSQQSYPLTHYSLTPLLPLSLITLVSSLSLRHLPFPSPSPDLPRRVQRLRPSSTAHPHPCTRRTGAGASVSAGTRARVGSRTRASGFARAGTPQPLQQQQQ